MYSVLCTVYSVQYSNLVYFSLHSYYLTDLMRTIQAADSPAIDQVGVEERIARFGKRSIKKDSKMSVLRLAMSMLDLTTLEAKDTPGKVKQL